MGVTNVMTNRLDRISADQPGVWPQSVMGSSEADALDSVANPDIRRYVFAPIKIV